MTIKDITKKVLDSMSDWSTKIAHCTKCQAEWEYVYDDKIGNCYDCKSLGYPLTSVRHTKETGGCTANLKEDGTCENPKCSWPESPKPLPISEDDIPF